MWEIIPDTEEDIRHREAVGAFYLIYNSLRKKRALRCHFHDDKEGARMEVWEYTNDGGKKTICRINAENSTDCHRMAADQLKREMQKGTSPIRQHS